tara:strand:- start:4211 stop:4867 length:657 start_codon:yes stop_codon:yes gene_type:complete
MVGLFSNNQSQQLASNSLNLSQTGAPMGAGVNGFAQSPMQNGMVGNPMVQGLFGGMGYGDQYNQYANAPVAPPSDSEILDAMLQTLNPIDKFFVSQQMPVFIDMLTNIMTFSLLNVLKNSTFSLNEEDASLTLDVTSLPSDLQTLSAENIVAQLSNLQNQSNAIIQNAEMKRQQILATANQSMLQGALGAALENPGMMESMGNALGSTARSLMFGGRA